MDQFGGSGKCADGASGGEGSMCGRDSASEVARTAAGGGGFAGRRKRHRCGVARVPEHVLCEVAATRRVCVRRSDSTNERWKVQEDGLTREICELEVERVISSI